MTAKGIKTCMRRIGDVNGMTVRFDCSLHAAALGGIFIDE